MSEIDAHSVRSSDPVHTIAGDLPPDACHWPACADPVCERREAGTCPLSGSIIVECGVCGAAKTIEEPCAACADRKADDVSFYEYPEPSQGITTGAAHETPTHAAPDDPAFAPTPRTHKRSSRQVLIVADDTTIIRHTQLRGLLEVAGNMKTLGEAIGVDPSTISRALAGSGGELARDERILAVRRLLGGEEGS